MGNKHVPGDPSAADLARLLVREGTDEFPIELTAIQVCNPDHPRNQPFGKRFQLEMTDLVGRVRALAAEKYRAIAERTGGTPFSGSLSSYLHVPADSNNQQQPAPESKELVLRLVSRQYANSLARAREISLQAANFAIDPETVIAPEFVKVLEERFGYDVEALRRSRDVEFFSPGYVWAQNADKQVQVRLRMLVNEAELDGFLALLRPQALGIASGRVSPADVVREEIARQAGEADRDRIRMTSYNDLVRKRTGLEVRSGFLNRVVDEIEKGNYNTAFRMQELYDIEYKYHRLEDMRAGLARTYRPEPVRVAGLECQRWLPVGEARDAPRAFRLNDDQVVTWYWVDLAEEWP
jgi:hypothetical protein